MFKWIAAVSLELGVQKLPEYLPILLPVLISEVSSSNPHEGMDRFIDYEPSAFEHST